MFAALSRDINLHNPRLSEMNLKVILVLDNADSINPNLFELITTIQERMRNSGRLDQPFSVVTFTRLSTSRLNVIGAIRNRAMYPHKSPLPAYVVLHSVVSFIHNRRNNDKYKKLDRSVRFELNARLLALVVNLVDGNSEFYETLNLSLIHI